MSIITIGPKTEYKTKISWEGIDANKNVIAFFKDDQSFTTIGVPGAFKPAKIENYGFNVFGIYTECVLARKSSWQLLYTKKDSVEINIRHTDYGGISFNEDKEDVLFIAEQWSPSRLEDDDWRARTIIQHDEQTYHYSDQEKIISVNKRSAMPKGDYYLRNKLNAILHDASDEVTTSFMIPEYKHARRFIPEKAEMSFYVDEKTEFGVGDTPFYDANDYWTTMKLTDKVKLPGGLDELAEKHRLYVYTCYSHSQCEKLKIVNIGIYSKPEVIFVTGSGADNGIAPASTNMPDVCRIEVKDGFVDIYRKKTTVEVYLPDGELIYDSDKDKEIDLSDDCKYYFIGFNEKTIDAIRAAIMRYVDGIEDK